MCVFFKISALISLLTTQEVCAKRAVLFREAVKDERECRVANAVVFLTEIKFSLARSALYAAFSELTETKNGLNAHSREHSK